MPPKKDQTTKIISKTNRVKTTAKGRPRGKVLIKRPPLPLLDPSSPPRGKGAPRYTMPFEDARAIVRNEGLGSHNDFRRWWNYNIPARIPKNPARTYRDEGWLSWGDWLGTYNTYPDPKKIYRSFHDAQSYARALRLKTKQEWLELAKAGKLPDDIPMHPNLAYGRTQLTGKPKRGGHWVSWKDFIGFSLADQLTAHKEKLNVLAIVKVDGFPSNIFSFITFNEFEQDIKTKLATGSFKVIKLYHISKEFDWGSYLKSKYSLYYNTKGAYTIANINEVVYLFDMNMPNIRI